VGAEWVNAVKPEISDVQAEELKRANEEILKLKADLRCI
tara:strand:- start:808 stop:924 length:117 start_codon:yes stop_codon:yes gene_type:complete